MPKQIVPKHSYKYAPRNKWYTCDECGVSTHGPYIFLHFIDGEYSDAQCEDCADALRDNGVA